MNLKTHIGRLRIAALIEGFTCVALYLIAMPLKYGFGIESAVKVPGMIHGIFFVAYLILLLPVHKQQSWNFSRLFICSIASIVPFMTFWADNKYFRNVHKYSTEEDILDA
jgi:integral membrane protein